MSPLYTAEKFPVELDLKPLPKTLTRAQMQAAAEKVTWRGSKTDFVTDLLHELDCRIRSRSCDSPEGSV